MSGEMLKKIAVVIPSLDPGENMPQLVKNLCSCGFSRFVLVDDGSKAENRGYFEQAIQFAEETGADIRLLRHAVNQGKGRALKTAFSCLLNEYKPEEISGVVTVDADGQHSPEDTKRVAEALLEEEALILGTRNFSKDTPFKSRYGNHITTAVFALLYGKKIRDTQTGLRGIPYGFLAECLRLEGERFEYEIKMLIDAVRCKWQIKEVEIQTIYVDSNRATHFHAVKDSLRIYRVLFGCFFGFAASGILSFLLDIGLFTFLTKTIFSTLPANLCILGGTVIARICSSLFNFSMNRSLVFKGKGKTSGALIRYYILCVCQMLCSWALVSGLFSCLDWEPSGLKVFVDLVLFFASYQIQRVWVFNKRK